LAIFAGNIEEGDKSRRLMCVLEPIKPIITFSYRCDNRFHTESLKEQLVNDDSYGFIIIDGSGCLFATVQGNVQTVLYRYLVDLPKKHRKGGQSSVRFARLRLEARHNYLIKVAEIAIKCFISNETNKLNVKGIVLAGSADFKDALVNEKLLDPRIQSSIIAVVDVAYGKEQGLNQAIILAAEALQNVNLVEQKKLFAKFFDEVNNSSSKVCYGLQQTMNALENGVIETLIIWENLPIIRNLVRNKNTNEESVVFTKPGQVPALKNQSNEEQPIEVIESETLVDYLAENYSQLKIQLQLVNDSTSEGSMFCQGFGGIGALLRYQFNLESEQKAEEIDEKEDEEEDDSKYWKDQLDGFVF